MNIFRCEECNYLFDGADTRAVVGDEHATCPACSLEMTSRSTVAWAIWNDCNGIFDVRIFRKDAESLLPEYKKAQCRVVPVFVISTPIDDHWRVGAAS